MINKSLGQTVRDLRDKMDLSLRELAGKVKVSAPFLSDVELGRRYPSDDVLRRIADELKTSFAALKQLDTRGAYADIKNLMQTNPQAGFAFRTATDKINKGDLRVEDLLRTIQKQPKTK
jgi:transcriptional regulator with XRE-family HTH domain